MQKALEQIEIVLPPGYVGAGIIVNNRGRSSAGNDDPRLGTTAIWDAVWATSEELFSDVKKDKRRAIILITDGVDTTSCLKADEAIKRAITAEVAIYAVGIGDDENFEGIKKSSLRKIAERTGGRAYFPRNNAELKNSFAQIEQELRSQYLVAYSPSNKNRDGLAERPSVFAVVSFGMNVRVLQSFTSELGKFDRAFDRLMKESGGLSTHTYDAVDDAIRMLSRKAPRTRDHKLMKRVIVVVTDGFPVGETVAPQTVIERANAAEVSIYTITLPSFSPALVTAGFAPLPTPLDVSGLVVHRGGIGIYATDKDFAPLLSALAAEVTSSYVLAFYATDEKRRDGRFHTIRVEAPSGLTSRQSRPGYVGNMH